MRRNEYALRFSRVSATTDSLHFCLYKDCQTLKEVLKLEASSTVLFKINKTKTCVREERESVSVCERERERESESKETEENDLTFKHGCV